MLEKSDIVESYRDGRKKYYSLDSEIMLEIVSPTEGKFFLFTTVGDATEIG